MLNSQDIEFFMNLSTSKSLAAAARKLNVTPPSISQRLQTLEKKLGVKLIERGVRAVSLTAAGEILAEKGKMLIIDLVDLQNDIVNNKTSISGKVKVLAPLGFGTHRIAPLIAEFQKCHPLITIDLKLSDNPQWSDKQSPDVMIYIGQLKDSSLKRIFLAKNKRLLVASPEYLVSAPPLNSPDDLAQHNCIALRENNEDVTMWKFYNHTQSIGVRVTPMLSSNVGQVVKGWALSGRGIIQRSEWDVAPELEQGKLLTLLPEYTLPSADIVALVSTAQENRPRKINFLIDFFKCSLEKEVI
jgi:DNA-binding transcriptional LysR family regulator